MIATCLLPVAGQAGILGQATTPSGAAFVNACAGSQVFSGLPAAGEAFNGGVTDQYVNCNFATSLIGGAATVSANNSGSYGQYGFSNDATASASVGVLHLGGHNDASAATTFAGSSANAGFNDTITIGGGSGQGIWIAPFYVDGALSSLGGGGKAQLWITAYQNFTQLDMYGNNSAAYQAFAAKNQLSNGDISSSWDTMAMAFGASGDGLVSMTVGRYVYFAMPITFGVAFEYGIYANFALGQSASVFSGQFHETADFNHTIGWGGGGYVIQGSNVISNPTYTSLAGINYSLPLAPSPEPASFGLVLLSAAGILAAVRRRRHQ
jgi:hypothetical protein